MMRTFLLACLLAACGPSMSGEKERGMMNCPSAVDGAKTSSARTDDGVDLTITADDAVARREIRMLARMHAAMREPNPEKAQHTGQHGGPGTIGHCPIVHGDTVVTFDEIQHGVTIHVTASSRADVAALQRTTEMRVAGLPADKR
jgi:hypothetical protein